MILRREVLDIALALSLRPQIVEKDYVLGWVLAGIYSHKTLSDSWIFKGGTCLKKCYFETYRFSEDLDFTIQDPDHINSNHLTMVFREIGEWVYENTGIEIPEGLQEFETFRNPRGTVSCQGKLSYRGPIAPRSGSLPRVKLDLTFDELLVFPPTKRVIFHHYSDVPTEGISVLSYVFEEAFAEKVRALGERTRPRDLYDVISLYRKTEARPEPTKLLELVTRKCAHHALPVPTFDALASRREDLEGSWLPMLGHQLQALPPLESFWSTLPEFFDWLQSRSTVSRLIPYKMAPGESIIREHSIRIPIDSTIQSYLETIYFAASNRLCVDLIYNGAVQCIEPYSLRHTRSGNIVLHAEEIPRGVHRIFRADQIQSAAVSNLGFEPRYSVELGPRDTPIVLKAAIQH